MRRGYLTKAIRCGLLAAVLGAAFLLGCGDGDRVEKQVGRHLVSFVPPSGWQYFDHGKQQAFEGDDARIVMKDLGLRLPPEEGGATLEEWLVYDIERLDTATQRGIAKRDSFRRDDRTFYVIDTWDRLTHDWRRRHVIVPDAGSHLAIYAEKGDWEITRDAIFGLMESLRFEETAAVEDEAVEDEAAEDGAADAED